MLWFQMNKYFAGQDFGYYFRVNHGYVKNKLKVVLLPFLHKVSTEGGAGGSQGGRHRRM